MNNRDTKNQLLEKTDKNKTDTSADTKDKDVKQHDATINKSAVQPPLNLQKMIDNKKSDIDVKTNSNIISSTMPEETVSKDQTQDQKEIMKKGFPFAPRTYNDNSTSKQYKRITWREAKLNADYMELTKHMFEEQAARIIQRAWRKHSKKVFKGKYTETLNGKLRLDFLKEPIDNKYQEHAKKINAGEYYKLNFDDPEFVRNIFKALRTRDIRIERAITAKLLYDASIEFKDEKKSGYPSIRQIPCDDDGNCGKIWQPKNISYMSQESYSLLKDRISTLPKPDRNYFIINFSQKRELLFLHHWLMRPSIGVGPRKVFGDIFSTFIAKNFDFSDEDIVFRVREALKIMKLPKLAELTARQLIDCFYKAIKDVSNPEKREVAIKILKAALSLKTGPNISALLYSVNKDYKTNNLEKRNKDVESSVLLMAFIDIFEEQGPSIAISPDFDITKEDSPLICMILPSMELFQILNLALFRYRHVTTPYFSLGQISIQMIRQLEDDYQFRPIEITHPDLKSSVVPHGRYVYDFILEWHDLFHVMRNSINLNKAMYRLIRAALTNATGYYMSKLIWKITDLDRPTNYPSLMIKEAIAKNDEKAEELNRAQLFIFSLQNIIPNFWSNPYQHHVLVIIFDMLLNAKKWEACLCQPVENYIQHCASLLRTTPEDKFFTENVFLSAFDKCKTIIQLEPSRSIEFYILIAQLNANNNEYYSFNYFLIRLSNSKLLTQLVKWDRNTGLHFNKKYCNHLTNTAIEKMTTEELNKNLADAAKFFPHSFQQRPRLENSDDKKQIVTYTIKSTTSRENVDLNKPENKDSLNEIMPEYLVNTIPPGVTTIIYGYYFFDADTQWFKQAPSSYTFFGTSCLREQILALAENTSSLDQLEIYIRKAHARQESHLPATLLKGIGRAVKDYGPITLDEKGIEISKTAERLLELHTELFPDMHEEALKQIQAIIKSASTNVMPQSASTPLAVYYTPSYSL